MKKVLLIALTCLLVSTAYATEPTIDAHVEWQLCPVNNDWTYGWTTVVTAVINLGGLTPTLHLYDLEVWVDGTLHDSIQADRKRVDVTGLDWPEFRLVDRETGDSWLLIRTTDPVKVACTTITPPTDISLTWIQLREWVEPTPRRIR